MPLFLTRALTSLQVEEWRRVIAEDSRNRWDQGEFNRIARLNWKPSRSDGLSDKRLFWSYKEQVCGWGVPGVWVGVGVGGWWWVRVWVRVRVGEGVGG